jgi:AraC family transcriptional activator of tynA and feaB
MVQISFGQTKPPVEFVRADTANERPRDRQEYWNEVVRKHVVQLDCQADSNQDLLCSMEGFSCNEGSVTSIRVRRRLSVRRSATVVDRESSEAVILNLLLKGEMHVAQAGNTCVMRPGDFSICTADRPYELEIPAGMHVACFRVPIEHLGCNKTVLKRIVAQRFSGRNGMTPLVGAYAARLADQRFEMAANSAELAIRHLALLLGAAAQESLETGSWQRTDHRERLILQTKYFVAHHIDDCALSVGSVASALRLSTRYLQQLWASEGVSLAGYIADTRLDRVAASLRNPARHQESLTQISMSHGFVNMSHFSRTFRQRYGVTPSVFREGSREPDRA